MARKLRREWTILPNTTETGRAEDEDARPSQPSARGSSRRGRRREPTAKAWPEPGAREREHRGLVWKEDERRQGGPQSPLERRV